MKRKSVILFCIPALLIALLIWATSSRQIPVELIGELPEKDVAEIISVTKCVMRKQILPEISWQAFKNMPGAVKRYSTIKLFTVVTDGRTKSALMEVWRQTNEFTRISLRTNQSGNQVNLINGSLLVDSNDVSEFIVLKKGSNGWTHPDYSNIIWHD